MLDSFKEWVSLLANIGTIIALVIAAITWWTWKKQQNYSFVRDKIFECELVFAQLLTCLENYFEIFEREVPFHPNRLNTKNLELTNVLLNRTREKLEPLWLEYELALYSLDVLNVNYARENLSNRSIYESRFKSYIQKFSDCKTGAEVKDISFIVFGSLAEDKRNGLNELRRIRNGL